MGLGKRLFLSSKLKMRWPAEYVNFCLGCITNFGLQLQFNNYEVHHHKMYTCLDLFVVVFCRFHVHRC